MKKMKAFVCILLVILCITSIYSSALLTANATDTKQTDNKTIKTVPQIHITTEQGNGPSLQKEDDYVKAFVKVVDTDGTTTEGDIQIKVRGNSTSLAKIKKKAFTIKFDSKTDLLDMGKAKKWTLLANAFDATQMRNYLAFDLAHTMGLGYTSEQRYVELWLDNSYRGCYILTEPVEEGSTRVDIDIESNDGMKDFLIEREHIRYEEDVTYFRTDNIRFAVKEPEEPNAQQLSYIQTTMDDIMSTIKEGNKEAISSKIDIESFARFYILNELFKTVDFDYSSVFFYYKDGVLYCGPVWDYDLSAGNVNSVASETAGNAASTDRLFASNAHFYKYLCTYDWFNDEISRTYTQYYDYLENIAAQDGLIDTLLDTYSDVFERNFSDTDYKPSDSYIFEQKKPLTTFSANVDYLKNWLYERQTWLSGYYNVPFIMGDVDNDKNISVLDATTIQFHIADIKALPQAHKGKADFNNDNDISILDATDIQRYIAQM